MNKINFNQSVGFPLETNILDKLQEAFFLMNAFGAIAGNFTIISGCQVSGSNVSNGTVYINGELLEFRGGVVQTNVRIIETVEALEFEDTNMNDVIYTRYVTFGTATTNTFPWASFRRGLETKEIAAQLADKVSNAALAGLSNLVNSMNSKLGTIETGANKNIQPNWTQGDTSKADYIRNKPEIISILHKGTLVIGDLTKTDDTFTISFPSLGTNNYVVVGSLVSRGKEWNEDNDVFWMVRNKQYGSFELLLREITKDTQNLSFDYVLIPL